MRRREISVNATTAAAPSDTTEEGWILGNRAQG